MGISVFVVDQERTFADALAARLEAEEDVGVVAAVHAKVPAQYRMAGRRADIMLLDGDLPDAVVTGVCEETSRGEGPTRVIILSHSSEPERIAAAIRAGAAAWVRKDDSLDHLLQVIRGVARGESWLPASETANVLRLVLRERDQRRENDHLLASLTSREREVLVHLADGAGRRDVADRLHLSANTVRTHLQNLMAKLGVHSALEAVALTQPQPAFHPGTARVDD